MGGLLGAAVSVIAPPSPSITRLGADQGVDLQAEAGCLRLAGQQGLIGYGGQVETHAPFQAALAEGQR